MVRRHVYLPAAIVAAGDAFPGGLSKYLRVGTAAATQVEDFPKFLASLPTDSHEPDLQGRPCLCSQCLHRRIFRQMHLAVQQELRS